MAFSYVIAHVESPWKMSRSMVIPWSILHEIPWSIKPRPLFCSIALQFFHLITDGDCVTSHIFNDKYCLTFTEKAHPVTNGDEIKMCIK